MYLGIMGGSFNPFHYGHLDTAKELRKRASLDKIIFVPLNSPPHKGEDYFLADPVHRYTMAVLGTIDSSYFEVNPYEIFKGGKSYTYETLCHFRDHIYKNDKLFFITGVESFEKITTWMNWEALLEEFNFIVNTREGYTTHDMFRFIPERIVEKCILTKDDKIKPAEIEGTGNILISYTKAIDISGTKVRNAIKNNEPIDKMVTPQIETYLKQHKLYE
ncbi:MAG: nicotinate (nicotinamide) nucleotide adenylyltransferase [Acidobacteria bacterium]|nr:nicotinate (nicotinamide) nucleotide adenylyltransferase [Acidobacteriota bacterium]